MISIILVKHWIWFQTLRKQLLEQKEAREHLVLIPSSKNCEECFTGGIAEEHSSFEDSNTCSEVFLFATDHSVETSLVMCGPKYSQTAIHWAHEIVHHSQSIFYSISEHSNEKWLVRFHNRRFLLICTWCGIARSTRDCKWLEVWREVEVWHNKVKPRVSLVWLKGKRLHVM